MTNAGGIGTIGGLLLSPNALKKQISEAKLLIMDKQNPKFGAPIACSRCLSGAGQVLTWQSRRSAAALGRPTTTIQMGASQN